ncbi:MAG: DUF4115 domain-containing protein [Desulfovibrio sp.]|nr:DUF4115 domain-containing protein [Desulfovibrio sp.]
MSIEEFGARLREERENRGLSLEDVANSLKISVRMLRALEDGDREKFPHVAYAKGFIRSYATFLGISPDETSQALASFVPAQPQVAIVPATEFTPEGKSQGGFLLLGTVLLLALLGGGAYYFYLNGTFDDAAEWVQKKIESFSQKNDDAEKRKHTPLSASRNDTPPPMKEEVKPEPHNDPLRASGNWPATEASTPAPSTEAPAVQEQKAEPTGVQQVVITATDACWIHSTADGTETRQFSLRKGDTFALTFREKLEVKLGNAGGVLFRYNGEELPPFGKAGQVKTVIFPSGEVL